MRGMWEKQKQIYMTRVWLKLNQLKDVSRFKQTETPQNGTKTQSVIYFVFTHTKS